MNTNIKIILKLFKALFLLVAIPSIYSVFTLLYMYPKYVLTGKSVPSNKGIDWFHRKFDDISL